MSRRYQDGARAARSVPWVSLGVAAAAAQDEDLDVLLDGLGHRGRCDGLLAGASARLTTAERAAVVASLRCPPAARRSVLDRGRVRISVAGMPGWAYRRRDDTAAPRHLLAGISDINDKGVQQVARNPSSPASVLVRLSGDQRAGAREGVASNPAAGPETLERLAADPDPAVRATVADNPASPSWLLLRLAEDDHVFVRAGVAGNPNCSREVVQRLCDDPDVDTLDVWATRSDATVEELRALASPNAPFWARAAVAAHPGHGPRFLGALAGDSDGFVRAGVARSPICTPALLSRLAGDSSAGVRMAVASARGCSHLVLSRLAADDDSAVRSAVAANLGCGPGTLVVLARDSNKEVRAVALATILARRHAAG